MKTPFPKSSSLIKFLPISLALAVVVLPEATYATSQTWDGGSVVNGNWSTTDNWSADTTAPINNQLATFNAPIANTWGNSAGNPITLSAALSLRFITVTGSSASYFIGTSGGNALTMAASSGNGGFWQIDSSLATSPTVTINAPVALATVTTAAHHRILNDSASGTLVINGNITSSTTSSGTTILQLQGTNTTANTVNGNITDNTSGSILAISKNTGAGKWILAGSNSYTGVTTVSAGTLLVSGTHTVGSGVTSATAYNITSVGTLGGSGLIDMSAVNSGVTLASGAKLAPGASVESLGFNLGTGVLDASGAVGGANIGALVFELGADTTPGGTYDQVFMTTGVLNIGSGVLEDADFSFTLLGGFGSGVYTLFDTNSTITGTLGSDVSIDFGSGRTGTLSLANGNTDLILTVVPEPSVAVLAVVGLTGAVLFRRRVTR